MVRAWQKPASVIGAMQASAPPATTTSTSSACSIRQAQAIASAPDAQAETGAWTPAAAPSSSPTWAAGPLGMSIGIVRTATLRRPSFSSRSSWSSRVVAPPMPVPMTTARRSPSTFDEPSSVDG